MRGMEDVVSRVLQLGVVVSELLVLAGVFLWAITGRSGYPPGRFPTTLGGVGQGLAALRPAAVVQAGLLTLILTPVIRVAASVWVFHRDRDRAFVAITLLVLSLLLSGMLWGAVG